MVAQRKSSIVKQGLVNFKKKKKEDKEDKEERMRVNVYLYYPTSIA
jgi:hypothetical protein